MDFDFTRRDLLSISHLRFKTLWLCVGVALICIVVVASIISVPQPIKAFMLQDKLLHTLTYACLMGWFAQIFKHDLTRLLLVISLVLLGVLMEFIQGMVPARQFEVMDMVANTSGVVLAWALAYTAFGNVLGSVENWLCQRLIRS